MKMKW